MSIIHTTLGVDLSVWRVTNFPGTVELTEISSGKKAVIPVPYDPQSIDWWKKMAADAIEKARGI